MNHKIATPAVRSQSQPCARSVALMRHAPRLRNSCGFAQGVLPSRRCGVALAALLLSWGPLSAQDFTVTSPGGSYTINNQTQSPTLTLVRGRTYTFSVNSGSPHPFQILSPGTAVNNNIFLGTITYTVATNALATINPGYRCSIHNFSGIILTVAPPVVTPPVVNILSLAVGTNLTMRSTGTNGWGVVPEFKTNLIATNWFALTVQTNRYLSGTNETICGKPAGETVFIRVRAQQN